MRFFPCRPYHGYSRKTSQRERGAHRLQSSLHSHYHRYACEISIEQVNTNIMAKKSKKSRRRDIEIRKGPFWVILGFLALLLAGIAADEPGRVLEQAKQICLSCIGIG